MTGGILTQMFIQKNKSWHSDNDFDLKKEINGILNDINNFVDVDMYDLTEYDDGYGLNLKIDYINKGIYDLLVEMSQVNKRINFVDLDYDVSSINDEFIKNNPITCIFEDENYVLKFNGDEQKDGQLYFPLYWILSDERYFRNVSVYGSLMMMNTMKTKYFQS